LPCESFTLSTDTLAAAISSRPVRIDFVALVIATSISAGELAACAVLTSVAACSTASVAAE